MRKQPQTSTNLITLILGELSDLITLILGELSDPITPNNTNLHNPKYGPSRYIIYAYWTDLRCIFMHIRRGAAEFYMLNMHRRDGYRHIIW